MAGLGDLRELGLECCSSTVSLLPWSSETPLWRQVTGQGGFAGIVQGTRALAEVSQYPLCSLTTPLGKERLIVSSYLKITLAGAPASVAGDAGKKLRCTVGKIARTRF